MLVGDEATRVLLSVFRLDDFHFYFVEKDFTKYQALKIFATNESEIIQASDRYLFSVDVVWLNFAILGHLYCQAAVQNNSKNMNRAFPKKYTDLLQINKEMFEQLTFSTINIASTVNNINNGRYNRNIVFTSPETQIGNLLGISNQIAFENFSKFLTFTSQLLRSDDGTLVQLALSILGQLIANVDDKTLDVIFKKVNIVFHIEHLLLCTDETIVVTLGKCIFTLFLRDVTFVSAKVVSNAKMINEIIFWALDGKESLTRIQCK